MFDLLEAEKVKTKAVSKTLNDLKLEVEKSKPKPCGFDCTRDHKYDGACLICGLDQF
jgi:hypothetical protein